MIETRSATLDNGLRVIVHPDRQTAMTVVDTIYNVGSRDESPTLTGIAHLFEHLMFGGSANVPHFDKAVERAGGINNAWTSLDFTNFYTMVPAQNIETALWVESDRMLAPRLDANSLEVQRKVVIEEFKQRCLATPYGDLFHHIQALAYKVHPYRWPTIGLTPDHVASVTEEQVRDFFETHYAPNNAVVVISGNIEPDRAFDLVNKYYGDIPRRNIAPRNNPPEPPMTEGRREVVYGNVPYPLVALAFPMAAHKSPDYVVADIITDILANGNASRLIREVVYPDNVVSQADASITGNEDPGLLLVNIILKESSPEAIAEGEELVWRQLRRLAEENVDPGELSRCTARYASTLAFEQMKFREVAEQLAIAALTGEDLDSRVSRYRAVSPGRVREVASGLFRPENCATVVYAPKP